MKIGVTQIILGGMTLEETLDLCDAAGYEALELVFSEWKDLDIHMSDDEIRAVGARCADAGIDVKSSKSDYAEKGNMLSLNARDREDAKKCLIRSIEIAHVLEAGAVLLHPGQLTAEGTFDQAWDGLQGILKEVASFAEEKQVAVCVENVWNKFLLSPREMASFVDDVGSDWVGVYLDTANMMAYGYPEHWVKGLGTRTRRVHFKDFARKAHKFVDLMDGDTNWQVLMNELRAIGYDLPVIHEVGGDRDALIETASRMKKIVAL
jgi:L-ribulose-5-phosphate 3-epimerase